MFTQQHMGMTVGAQALRALQRYPERIAFTWDGGEMSYRAAADMIGRMQKVLLDHGIGHGDRVGILSANRVESWCAGVAVHLCGAATSALHPRGAIGDHVYQLDDCAASALVVDNRAFPGLGGELATRGTLKVFTLDPADYGVCLPAAAARAGAVSPRNFASADDIATLNYTGGTTGRAKGIIRRHHSAVFITTAILTDFELPAAPRYLAVAPISHVAGTKVLPVLMRGGCVHLAPGFDPVRVLDAIGRERINCTLLVPTMVYAMLAEPGLAAADLSSLELVLYGASPMSPYRLQEALERFGPVFAQLYGQTECHPIAYLPKADHDLSRPGLLAACGHPASSSLVALLDEEGVPVAPGEAGEICVRGPNVMEAYWGQEAQTAEALRFGWLHTGDVARADEQGRLYMVDRKKDMVVTGGFNVFSRTVEDVLTGCPGVAQAAVIGVPDARWGEAVMAIVVRQPDARVSAEELIRAVKQSRGAAHAPKQVQFVDALPTTSLGKIDKKALRARYWAGQDRQVG